MRFDVFISYPQRDRAIADTVCAKLEADGIKCWIAPRDISVGGNWPKAIIDAIDRSKVFALILSSSANDSTEIARETARASRRRIPIVPFRIEDVDPKGSLAYHLESVQFLDAQTRPIEPHLQRLAESIKRILGPTRR
jgi:hypothetical protein